MNGVKIAVPITKMSREDLEYVENLTGISLEDEKPLADVRRSKSVNRPSEPPGAKVERNKKPEYDWFQFFLSCEVPVGLCERYAQAFIRDSMDESVLPDVNAVILRTLGIREGDIIKIMRTLDTKFGRERNAEGDSTSGGLFSGPGGALRNNTRKGRPAPAVQTNDVVDAATLSKDSEVKSDSSPVHGESKASSGGFDDDAWELKPSKQPQPPEKNTKPAEPAPAHVPVMPALTDSMKDLSMLSAPLEPTKAEPSKQPESTATTSTSASTLSQAQPLPGATPSFFSSVPGSQTGGPSSPKSLARQRPAPTIPAGQGSLPPPPTQRPISAPQQQSAFATPALSTQMTGLVQGQVAPPGQSLNDMTQARLQQQYTAQMQQMQTLQPTMTGFGSVQNQPSVVPYQTGSQYMQPMYTGAPTQSPFQDPGASNQFSPLQAQHTAYPLQFQPQSSFGQASQGNVNNYLPPALEPQRTGMVLMQQPQATGFNSFNPQPPQALQSQKTGPPPPVRFGVTDAKKLTAQPTGRRANLSQASKSAIVPQPSVVHNANWSITAAPQNPFGF